MLRNGSRSKPVWKSTSELGYLRIIAETFVNLHAIEQMQLRGQRRVDGLGRPKFDFLTGRSPKGEM